MNRLAARAEERESEALADLAEQREYLLRRARRCLTPVDAQDLVHDTLLRALQRRHQFRSGTNLRGWLLIIMRNLMLDRCRLHRRERRVACDQALAALAAPEPTRASDQVDSHQLERAIAALEPWLKRTVELVALERRSYRQAAAALGIPVATVGSRLHRARKQLRSVLVGRLARRERPARR